jgi:hypothetical protein
MVPGLQLLLAIWVFDPKLSQSFLGDYSQSRAFSTKIIKCSQKGNILYIYVITRSSVKHPTQIQKNPRQEGPNGDDVLVQST